MKWSGCCFVFAGMIGLVGLGWALLFLPWMTWEGQPSGFDYIICYGPLSLAVVFLVLGLLLLKKKR